jgi:hypothetical protein
MNEQESKPLNVVPLVASLALLASDVVLLLVIIWITTDVRDRFEKIFSDFEAQLPVLTKMFLSVPGSVYVVMAASFGIFLLVKELTISNQSVKLGINLVAGVVLLAFAALFPLTMLLPWMTLIQSMR